MTQENTLWKILNSKICNQHWLVIRAITEFIICAVLLSFAGCFAYHAVDARLTEALEESVILWIKSVIEQFEHWWRSMRMRVSDKPSGVINS